MPDEVTINAVGGNPPRTPAEAEAYYHLDGAFQVGSPEVASVRALVGIGYGLLAVVAELRAARS